MKPSGVGEEDRELAGGQAGICPLCSPLLFSPFFAQGPQVLPCRTPLGSSWWLLCCMGYCSSFPGGVSPQAAPTSQPCGSLRVKQEEGLKGPLFLAL